MPVPSLYTEDVLANFLRSPVANSKPSSRAPNQNWESIFGNSVGASNTAPGTAPSSPTAQSAAVGNAAVGAVGNMVMSAVIGPVAMGLASLAGLTPPSAFTQIAQALGITGPGGPAGVSPNGSVSTGPATATDADTGESVGVSGGLAVGTTTDGVSGGGDSAGDSGGDSGGDGGAGGGDSTGGDGGVGGDSFHTGGYVTKTGKANLLSDEFVLHRGVVEAFGRPFLDSLNSGIPNVMGG